MHGLGRQHEQQPAGAAAILRHRSRAGRTVPLRPAELEVGPATTGAVRVVVVAPIPAPGEEVTRSLTVTANDGSRYVEAPITFQQSASVSAMTTLSLRVEPSIVQVQDTDGAIVQVVVDNRRGQSGLRLFLEGHDPERAIDFSFTPPVVDVGSGQMQPVNVQLASRRPQPGQELTRQFTITASDGRTSVEGAGSLVQASSRTHRGWGWLMIVLGIILLYLGFFGIGHPIPAILGAIALIIGVVLLFKRSRSRRTRSSG